MYNLLIHTVDITRPTATSGSNTAEADAYTTVYSALPCLVSPMAASFKVQYAARKIDATHTILTNQNPTVHNGDQITFGTRTFYVQGIRNANERGLVLAIDCLEIL